MERIEIKAVDLVRRIRDQHCAMLQDKTLEEIMAFFHQEALSANAEATALLEAQHAGGQVCPSIQTDALSRQGDAIPTAT